MNKKFGKWPAPRKVPAELNSSSGVAKLIMRLYCVFLSLMQRFLKTVIVRNGDNGSGEGRQQASPENVFRILHAEDERTKNADCNPCT